MNERFVVIDDFAKESKKRQAKVWFENKVNEAKDWFDQNRELVMILGPSAIGAITWGAKTMVHRSKMKREENLKNLYCYDRSLGHYWKLRRELSNAEWVQIDKRKKNGERLADILSELKVLR